MGKKGKAIGKPAKPPKQPKKVLSGSSKVGKVNVFPDLLKRIYGGNR